MENKKEKRTEYVGLYLTPTMAKQLKEADDNETLKDKIIKDFVTNETNWLKDEVQNMDEITTIYRAKLLTIKDNFSKAQDIYVEEIEKLLNVSYESLSPLGDKFVSLQKDVEHVKANIESASKLIDDLSKKVGYIDYSRLERLLDAVDRFNSMGEYEKELIKLILLK